MTMKLAFAAEPDEIEYGPAIQPGADHVAPFHPSPSPLPNESCIRSEQLVPAEMPAVPE